MRLAILFNLYNGESACVKLFIIDTKVNRKGEVSNIALPHSMLKKKRMDPIRK